MNDEIHNALWDIAAAGSTAKAEKEIEKTKALLTSYADKRVREELQVALDLTKQAYFTGSPFANVENINRQTVAITNSVLSARLAQLTNPKETP